MNMKDITSYINEASDNYPMQGIFKKGDDAIILLLDEKSFKWGEEFNFNDVKQEIPVKIDKVVSKALARYRNDYHTWVYVTIDDKPVRFELKSYLEKFNLKGIIDYDFKKNPKNIFGYICTPDDLKELKK